MLNLAEYRRHAARLADYMPWAALVAPGMMVEIEVQAAKPKK